MKIAISGATGFVGRHLSAFLVEREHEVLALGREWFQEERKGQLNDAIAEVDVVINLAGAPINHRWTSAYKQILCDSRVIPTRKLVEAVNQSSRPQLFISASAVGYYPSEGCYDEYNSVKGQGFLSDLCETWEAEASRVRSSARLVITRFGVVLAVDGGVFKQLLRSLQFGMAAMVGGGKQSFSWIDLEDLMRAIAFIIDKPELHGIFNFVAPQQLTNAEFTCALAKHYHKAMTLKVPTFIFRGLYGEGASFLTQGQCVTPTRLTETAFGFQSATIEQFLTRT